MSKSVREQIRELLQEKSPRIVSELSTIIYGDASLNHKVQITHRLKDMIRRGEVWAERTGPAQNALVRYHLAEPVAADNAGPDEQLHQIQQELHRLAAQVAQLRVQLAV